MAKNGKSGMKTESVSCMIRGGKLHCSVDPKMGEIPVSSVRFTQGDAYLRGTDTHINFASLNSLKPITCTKTEHTLVCKAEK